ncbi:lipoprotein [Streptomyces cinnabarinus]|uniref:Lipoprotein n=1 Tax=Streptomyces cinnabarinus TaxID=67287 RepID=A0ABY7KSM7_9ACTN|nr:lipoprotein [Streptomyces cinnabarinus]WAZ26107.1 lipoprotein [Streptomyces cinnabarinus]
MGRRAACAAVLVVLLTGCSSGAEDKDAKASASPSAAAKDSSVADSGRPLGGKGSDCELPVTFDIAEEWTAESVEAPLDQGPVTLACEVDAKPAGNIGFLRAWTGEPGDGDARSVLEAFVAAQGGVNEEKYGSFTTGGLTGAEVTYVYSNELLEESKQESALAVTTPLGPVVLHLGGLDTEEHKAMLPALELAKKTLRSGRAE